MDIYELIRKEGLRRGLSPRTIKTYCLCVGKFFRVCHKEPYKVKKADIHGFLDKLIEWNKSSGTLNVYVNALKFLCQKPPVKDGWHAEITANHPVHVGGF